MQFQAAHVTGQHQIVVRNHHRRPTPLDVGLQQTGQQGGTGGIQIGEGLVQ